MSRTFALWLAMIAVALVITAVLAAPADQPAPPADPLTQLLWPALMQTSAAATVVVVVARVVEELTRESGR